MVYRESPSRGIEGFQDAQKVNAESSDSREKKIMDKIFSTCKLISLQYNKLHPCMLHLRNVIAT